MTKIETPTLELDQATRLLHDDELDVLRDDELDAVSGGKSCAQGMHYKPFIQT